VKPRGTEWGAVRRQSDDILMTLEEEDPWALDPRFMAADASGARAREMKAVYVFHGL